MPIKINQQEAQVLSQMAYMNIAEKDEFEQYIKYHSLEDIAKYLLKDRDERLKAGEKPRDFGRWGGFTNKEQYDMLQKIADGDYKNLSNLKIKDYVNNEAYKDKFVAYAFQDTRDPQNVICAFRGSMGNRIGEEDFKSEINGKFDYSWSNNFNQMFNDVNPQYAMSVDFVKKHMVLPEHTLSVGHSQGGGDALYTSAVLPGVRSMAFDAPGIRNSLTEEQAARLKEQGINIAGQMDFVSSSGSHPEERLWVQYVPYPKLDINGNTVLDKNGQIEMLGAVSGGHYLQTQNFTAEGKVIPGVRSEFSESVEVITQKLLLENKAEGNRMGDDFLLRQIVVLNDPEGAQKIIQQAKQLHPETAKELDDRLVRIQAEAEKIQATGKKIDTVLGLQPGATATTIINSKLGYDSGVLFLNTIEKHPEASRALENQPSIMAGINLLGGLGHMAHGVDYYSEGISNIYKGITSLGSAELSESTALIKEGMHNYAQSINHIGSSQVDFASAVGYGAKAAYHEFWMPRAIEQMKSLNNHIENFNPYESVRNYVKAWPQDGHEALEILQKMEDQNLTVASFDRPLNENAPGVNNMQNEAVRDYVKEEQEAREVLQKMEDQNLTAASFDRPSNENASGVNNTQSLEQNKVNAVLNVEQTTANVFRDAEIKTPDTAKGGQENINNNYQNSIKLADNSFSNLVNYPEPPAANLSISLANTWGRSL